MAKTVVSAAERIEEKFKIKWQKVGVDILKPPPSIPTGSLQLDEAIGDCKGYPEGAIIEAFGPQHSGKTLMGYLAIAASQRAHRDRDHLIIDAENQFKFQARWAHQVGVDVEKLYVQPVTSAEEAFDIIEISILGDVELDSDGLVKKIVNPGNFGVIMIDSVTQLVPLEMIHKSMDKSQRMASLAAVMSHGLKKVVSAMSLARSKSIVFFINQTRANPRALPGTNPETRTGGLSLPFYNTIAFRVSKIKHSEERDERGKIFAHQVKIRFDKNKAGQLPAKPIIFRLRYDGTGIDNDAELFNVGTMNGIIAKIKRGQFNFIKPGTEDEILDESIESFKEEEFGEVIENNPKMKQLILEKIKEGKFYRDDDPEEEDPDAEDGSIEENKTETKVETKTEEPKVQDQKTEENASDTKEEKSVEQSTDQSEQKVRRRRRKNNE